jgi:hypothetical protein
MGTTFSHMLYRDRQLVPMFPSLYTSYVRASKFALVCVKLLFLSIGVYFLMGTGNKVPQSLVALALSCSHPVPIVPIKEA